MEKVIVIGCPGSGKTAFSQKLASITGLPLVHLDRYYHDGLLWDADPVRKRAQWKDWITSQVRKSEWIIDGNYKSTLDIRVQESDTVIFLDYPRHLSLWRIFKRRFFSRGLRKDMPSGWKEKVGWDLLRFAWSYNWKERPKVLSLLENETMKRIVILESPASSEEFLKDAIFTISTSHPRS